MDYSKDKLFLTLQDYSVSKEPFTLYYDSKYEMLITDPQPKGADLSRYYESEDYISHTDSKRSLFEKMYHWVKSYALRQKLQLINGLCSLKGNLLDIGAGTGEFLLTAKEGGWNAKGLEPNEKARSIAENKGISIAESLDSLPDNSFDVITMWHVLEHVPDLDAQIKTLKRLLKPDGAIVIAVPNYKSFDAQHYGNFWAAYDVPRHLWHFSKKSIERLFANEQMVLKKVLPMKFDAFYVSLLSEKYKTGKMNFIKAFLVGFGSNLKAKSNLEYSSLIYILKNS